jgi:succinyl-CoA synthetase beta subunit
LVLEARGRPLTERESKDVLHLYEIPASRERLTATIEQARAAAADIGYPIALKVESPGLVHKTEAGGVLLGLADAAALEQGYARVLAHARQAEAEVRGVLVQEMAPPGWELIVGMSQDPQFGPVIACGLGGIFVEVVRDVQLLLPPISEVQARAALQRLRAFRLLQAGGRGHPPADLDAIVDVLVRFSELCGDVQDLVQEIDINPLLALPKGVLAVDCLVVPR